MTLALLGTAWLLGVVAAAATGALPWPAAVGMAALGPAAALLARRWQMAALAVLAAALFLGGAARYLDSRPPDEPTGLALLNDGPSLRLRALVSDEPEERPTSQRIRLSARDVYIDGQWQPIEGGVLVWSGLFPRYRYGDLLELEGKPETPPELPGFNYRDYLAGQGIGSVMTYPHAELIDSGQGNGALAAVHGIRRRLGEALEDALPEPQAALARGILLGQRSALPQDLADDLNDTGTSHLIAISGHNVSIVAGIVIASLAWLGGRRNAALLALAAIAAYTVLTGASPTVVRAAIMGGLFIVATLLGRPASALTSIVLAAALMTAWDPLVVEDVSFQLSFAAILGIAYLAPSLRARGEQAILRDSASPDARLEGIPAFLLECSAVTLGAVAATLPLIALNFHRISLVTLFANLFLLPAFPFILVVSALTALAGVLWSGLGQAVGWVAWVSLTYMIEVARFFADIPLASLDIDLFEGAHAALFYVLLAVAAWALAERRPGSAALDRVTAAARRVLAAANRPLRLLPAPWLLGALALAAALAWWAVLSQPHGRLTVSIMDVGQGDAIFVHSPEGHQILIDGGPSAQAAMEALGRELPFWDRSLDLVVLTHPEEDHLVGLVRVLERYDVEQVMAGPIDTDSAAYGEWQRLIAEKDIAYVEASAGAWADLGDGAILRVLGPPEGGLQDAEADLNNNSLVLKLSWGRLSFLLTGDLETEGEDALLDSRQDLRAAVLKVPHHGAANSSSEPFLDAVQPTVAVISVGEDNTFRHPAFETLERLRDTLLYRTDQHGRVRLSTDGQSLWISPDRTP